MRPVFVALANFLLLLRAVAGVPFRLLRARERPTFVRFRLTGNLPYRERKARRLPWQRPEPATLTSLAAFREALEHLAADPLLKGILLELEGSSLPPAKRDVVVDLLAKFRRSGKRVVGYAVSADNSAFQVLCAADEVLLSPAGRLELVGYHAEATAIGGGLAKLGVTAHFVRRGNYKTAPELFTHPEVSDIQRETIEAFLDERYEGLIGSIVAGRRRTPAEARALIDAGPYSSRRAHAAGLIDGRASEHDLPERLGLLAKRGEPKLPGSYATYCQHLAWPPVRWRPLRRPARVGVVEINGMIASGKGGLSPLGPRVAGSATIVRAVRAAARDRATRAIVLHVGSPGGSAMASEIILEAVRRAALKKPVLAYADTVSASGGYMAMLGAQEIWSSPHALVGSIGVFAGKFDFSGLFARLGIHRTVLTRGQNAGIQSPSRGLSPSERASLEAEVEETYQAFLADVAQARKMSVEEVHARAEGRVYSGTRALAVGLVDRTGGFEEACARALALAKVETDRFELTLYSRAPRRFPLLALFGGGDAFSGLFSLCPLLWEQEAFKGLPGIG